MPDTLSAVEIKMNGCQPLMNARQEAFCLEYLLDLNATSAAIRAGYSKKTAAQQGARLFRNVNVAARISFLKAERVQRTEVNIDRVVEELAKVGFASLRQMVEIDSAGQPQINLSNTPDDVLDALSEVSTETVIETEGSGEDRKSRPIRKTKVKLHDKIRALHLLAAHVSPSKQRKGDTAHPFVDMVNQLLRTNHKHNRIPIKRDGEDD
jgi:phage terminase small subunit